MSLVNAPIAERRKWVFEVASKLYHLQRARFGFINGDQANAMKTAWNVVKLERGPEYMAVITQTITTFDITDIINLNNYWKVLLTARSDQDFARILTPGGMHPDQQTPSEIIVNVDYIDTAEETVDQEMAQGLIAKYRAAIKEGKMLTPIEAIKELARYAVGFGSFVIFNLLRNFGLQALDNRMVNEQTVPCTLSGLPLRHIQGIEVARSGKILKFRATGSVFLANQEGGEDAIRIDGLLIRSEIIFIFVLWMIFYFGQGKVKEIDGLINMLSNPALMALRAKNIDITSFNKSTQKPAYTHHVTVPFVTRHVIIPNVYIETLSFEERLDLGKDVIGYSILLRTYRKPLGFDMYAEESSSTTAYIAPKGNKNLSMYKVIEFFANMAWRGFSALGLYIDERSWKIGGDNAESDDVYYNISPLAIASSVVLGLVGLRL